MTTNQPIRERIKWRIAFLLGRLPGNCWSRQVDWVMGYRRNPISPVSSVCREDFARCGSCYCGKLREPASGAPSVAEGVR